MLRVIGRRGMEAGISLFAVLGFCYVPLGAHTGLQHAKAILGTPAAKRAGAELVEAFLRVRGKLGSEAQELAAGATSSTSAALPAPHKSGAHEHPHRTPASDQ